MAAPDAPDVAPVRDTTSSASASFFHGFTEGRRFSVQEVIGQGSYGTVCSAIDNLTGERVAIKRIKNVFEHVADATRILREIILLRRLQHPDIVTIKHIMLPPDPRTFKDVYVVFELMESDLHTVIGANDDLTPNHHKVFLYQLLRGLAFIHETGVLHRDLKPKNILANSNCKLKICDFGLARPYFGDEAPCMWTDYVATRWYRAPELCGCFYDRYSQAIDIWSIGCMFAETLLGAPLFPGRDAPSQLQLITDLLGKPPPEVIDRISNQKARVFLHAMPKKAPMPFEQKFRNLEPEGLDLLRQLLSFAPMDRPTAVEALQHPYFANLPAATPVDCAPISTEDFMFENHRLTEADVRNLIYVEILHYHPHVAAQYQLGTCRLPPQMVQFDTENDDVRRQFMYAEQFGLMPQVQPQAGSVWRPPSASNGATAGAASSWPTHQQVGAHRDPTAIAAAAAAAAARSAQQIAAAPAHNHSIAALHSVPPYSTAAEYVPYGAKGAMSAVASAGVGGVAPAHRHRMAPIAAAQHAA